MLGPSKLSQPRPPLPSPGGSTCPGGPAQPGPAGRDPGPYQPRLVRRGSGPSRSSAPPAQPGAGRVPAARSSPRRGPPARAPSTHLTLAATDDMASFLSVFLLDTAVPIFARGEAAGGALIAQPRGCPCRGGAGCRGAPPPLAAARPPPVPQRPAMPRRPRPAPPRCPRRLLRSAAAAASSLTAAGGRARAPPAAQEAPLYLAGGSPLRPRPADIMAGRPRLRRLARPGDPREGQLSPTPAGPALTCGACPAGGEGRPGGCSSGLPAGVRPATCKNAVILS